MGSDEIDIQIYIKIIDAVYGKPKNVQSFNKLYVFLYDPSRKNKKNTWH